MNDVVIVLIIESLLFQIPHITIKELQMTITDAIKIVEKTGTKISKEKLLDAIKRSTEKEFHYGNSVGNGFSIILVRFK